MSGSSKYASRGIDHRRADAKRPDLGSFDFYRAEVSWGRHFRQWSEPHPQSLTLELEARAVSAEKLLRDLEVPLVRSMMQLVGRLDHSLLGLSVLKLPVALWVLIAALSTEMRPRQVLLQRGLWCVAALGLLVTASLTRVHQENRVLTLSDNQETLCLKS